MRQAGILEEKLLQDRQCSNNTRAHVQDEEHDIQHPHEDHELLVYDSIVTIRFL